MYQKEIIYMGLHKDGSRLGSAGFLKVESRDKESSLFLKVKNIPHSINGRFPVRFYNGMDWKEVDGITLQEGNGQWEECEPESLRQVRLQIILPGGYLIEGISKEAEKNLHERRQANDVRGDKNTAEEKNARTGDNTTEEKNIRTGEDTAEERPTVTGEQTDSEEAAIKRNVGTDSAERIPVQKQRRSVQEVPAQAPVMVSEELPPPMAEQMQINGVKEDKWEQILDTYDQIHPYGDERVYVKLEPKDFVILQEAVIH